MDKHLCMGCGIIEEMDIKWGKNGSYVRCIYCKKVNKPNYWTEPNSDLTEQPF